MSITPNSEAILNLNACIQIVQTLQTLQSQVAELVAENSATPFQNAWNLLNTTALNSDGTLGTADTSPNASHPIDSRVYQTLLAALTPTQAGQLLAAVVSLGQFCEGNAVGANGTIQSLLAAVAL